MRTLARWHFAVVAVVGCAHVAPPTTTVAVVAAPPRRPIWPVRVRVMTWTADGPVQVGELPDAPPREMPPVEPWYVEPEIPLDGATLVALVEALRSQHVPGLSLRAQPIERWPDGLRALRELPALHALSLDDTAVSGAELAGLAVTLDRLYLARTGVDDAAIVAIAASHPHLEVLVLEDCAIGDAAAEAIGTLHDLHAVNLVRTAIDDAGGARLRTLPRLEVADLGHTKVGAKTVDALRALPLRELFLDGTQVGAEVATLAPIAATLERVDLSSLARRLADADVDWIANAPHLIEVGLDGAPIHDLLVGRLLALPDLRRIRIAGAQITVATARTIAARRELVEVDLAETVADDATAAALLTLPNLRILRLDHTPITDRAFAGPTYAPLTELYASRTQLTDTGTRLLADLPHLGALGLGDTRIGAPTLARIARLSDLHTLVLSKVHADADAFAQLGALRRLKRLYLDETSADDEVTTAISHAFDLRVLHLAGSQITEASLATLAGLRGLEELTLGDTRIHAIATLDGWPRLRTLSLVGLDVGDAALPALARGAALTALDVSATEVHDPAALAAAPHLHILGLSQTNLSPAGLAAAAALTAKGIAIVR